VEISVTKSAAVSRNIQWQGGKYLEALPDLRRVGAVGVEEAISPSFIRPVADDSPLWASS
jgi:hypothetical protein